MTREEKIMLENHFNTHQFDNNRPVNNLLNNALVVLLNSIEFTDTQLKISSKKHKSHLIQLTVDSKNIDATDVYVSGLYVVTDGELTENRSFTGNIEFYNMGIDKEVNLSLNIDRLSIFNETILLNEWFRYIPLTECTHREYNYLGQGYRKNKLAVLRKDDAIEFLEEELRLIKKRG